MQRIERYGVIALVFLLVTIVAVSLWGERKKTDGWFSFLKRDSKASRVEALLADASTADDGAVPVAQRNLVHGSLPLSESEWKGVGQQAFDGPDPAPREYRDQPVHETGSIVPPEPLPEHSSAYAPESRRDVEAQVPFTAPASEYTIRPGDTLSQIAQRELGTKNRWRELLELNPGIDPAKLPVGTKIRLTGAGASKPVATPQKTEPKLAAAKPSPASTPSPAGGRSYSVRSGDTLSQIAQRELGSKDRWRELVELNPGLDPAKLHVGTSIRLPGGEAPRETRVARAESAPAANAPAAPKGSKVR